MKKAIEKQNFATTPFYLAGDDKWQGLRWIFLLCFSFFLFSEKTLAQSACPELTVSPNVTICSGCTTLTATPQGTVSTTSYSVTNTPYVPYSFSGPNPVLVSIDDHWSAAIAIPFCFQFYGNTYSQCVIGSNAVISFNLANANNYNTWPVNAAVPAATPADLLNCIMAPWHDIDPSVTSYSTPSINWGIYGTAPCRAFVVSWTNCSMFSCNSEIATSQLVLYETTNIIDIYIQDKPLCSTWNGGNAIEGIQDSLGAQAVTVPGRNYPTQWTATNDGQRFTPAGAPQYTITWYAPPNTAIGTTATISVCPTTTTTYTAKLVNNTCSGPITITAPVTVSMSPPPCNTTTCNFIAHGDTVCVGSTIFLSADSVANATFKWRGPNGYTASVRNPTIVNAIPTQSGWYYAKDTMPNCTYTDSAFVQVNSSAVANAGADQTICIGSTVTLDGSISAVSINGTWSGGSGTYSPINTASNAVYTPSAAEAAAGTVTLTYTPNSSSGSCAGVSDQMTITITHLPIVNAGTALSVCSGASTTLAGSIGGSATSGTWSGGTGTYSPDNTTLNATYTPSAAEYAAGSATLTLTTDDPPGPCTFASSNVTLHFYQNPVVNFAVDTAAGCTIHCTGFTNSTIVGGGDNITSWAWDFGDGSSGSDLSAPYHCFSQPGFYDVKLIATSNHGCISSLAQPQLVHVFSLPIAEFSPTPTSASIIDPAITFSNQCSSDVNYWHWNFGDSTSLAPSTSSPVHYYADSVSGNYWVTLIVHNAGGCYDTVRHEVFIEPGFTFYIPNSFSPNGNGVNDYFYGCGTGILNYEFWIFDRWGNLIFHTNDLNGKWDGKAKNGDNLQIDLYVWKVELTDAQNKKHNYVGTVTLTK